MNALLPIVGETVPAQRGEALLALFERVCRQLEPTGTQFDQAKGRYETVGGWVADAPGAIFRDAKIYPQGSFAIGTVIRPLHSQEFDVDLVCHFPNLVLPLEPSLLKRELGQRLRDHGTYRDKLEEMPRCWRVMYANEFHLDITPSIRNPRCLQGGDLVPDKKARAWKPSHPLGYKAWFDERAALKPRFVMRKSIALDEKRAEVAPFPVRGSLAGILRRIVQLSKRHRDVMFEDEQPHLPPISVIITTLAAKSYARQVTLHVHENEFELLRAVVRDMPDFIDHAMVDGEARWIVRNEATTGENFAEKWNKDPERAGAFFSWHRRFVSDLNELAARMGLDMVTKGLSSSFGQGVAEGAMRSWREEIDAARSGGALRVAPVVGLIAGTAAAVGRSTPVRANTFFGVG